MFLAGLTAALLGVLGLPAGAGGRWLRRSAAAVTAAGLLAAGTAVALAGTGRLDPHGMIAIPALHDAASDRPVPYTPVCSHTADPGLPAPRLRRLPARRGGRPRAGAQRAGGPARRAGPGQPGRRDLPAGPGNGVEHQRRPPGRQRHAAGVPTAPARPDGQRATADHRRDGRRRSEATAPTSWPASSAAGRVRRQRRCCRRHRRGPVRSRPGACHAGRRPSARPGPAVTSARLRPPGARGRRRFAALPAATRHAWLAAHLAALRAGQITLAQLP